MPWRSLISRVRHPPSGVGSGYVAQDIFFGPELTCEKNGRLALNSSQPGSMHDTVVLRSGVNFTHFLQKWPKIQHSSPKCLQQSMTFQKSSFSCPAVLTYESDGVSDPPALG